MLRSVTAEQFQEWQAFDQLEPMGPEREDYRIASILQTLWNIARDRKRHPDSFKLAEFLIPFGDVPIPKGFAGGVQTAEWIEQQIDAWIFTSNAILEKNRG